MSLSSLPWFIRREVIDSVIEENPEYCSISREWMRQVAIRHGRLYISDRDRNNWSSTPFTPFIESITFRRSINIDWNTLLRYKNLKNLGIFFMFEEVSSYTEFTSKLEGLPPLSSIQLVLPENQEMDLSNVFKKGKNHFDILELSMNYIKWYPFDTVFSKLKILKLYGISSQFSIQDITRNMPNLNKLFLCCDISFNNDVMSTIVDLEVKCPRFMTYTTLELSLFPQLKQLKVVDLLLTSLASHKNQIDSLSMIGTVNQIMQIRNITFLNLKELYLFNDHNEKLQGLGNLFRHLTTLTTLTEFNLKVCWEADFPDDLPEGPYSFTNFALQGPFLITPHSLTWLSKCFKLTYLYLELCVLKNDVKLPTVQFENLKTLIIYSLKSYYNSYSIHFNQVHYPHVKIDLLQCSYDDN